MDEHTQQIVALLLVAVAVAAELWRRRRKKQRGKAGCDGCDSGTKPGNTTDQPLRFYRRR